MRLELNFIKNFGTCNIFRLIFLALIFSFSSAGNLVKAEEINDSIHVVVDRAPQFRGTPSNIQRFTRQHVVYPGDAWVRGIEGVVEVSLVVTRDGSIKNVSITESVDPMLDFEALRVVDLMTSWRPALKDGKEVHARVTVPVEFSLSPQEQAFVGELRKHGLQNNLPLYVIDNKIVQSRIHLPSYNIRSLRVLKGEPAIEQFGEAAKNGVVKITTKRGTPPVR